MAIRMGVIGTGRIGQVHAEHLATRIRGARLVTLTDVDRASAEQTAERLGVASIAQSASAVIANPEIDAVAICSSTDTHADLIIEAARAKKHIFCEKPIDHDLGHIDAALAAVEQAGVKLQIGFNRRFDPNFLHVKEQVAAGRIGEPHLVRITSRDPAPPPIEYVRVSGGLFLDMTIHDFDMARYLTCREAARVYATGSARVDRAIGEAGDIDTAVVVLEMDGGCIVTIDNSRKAAYGYDQRVEVFGSAGVIWADNNTAHRTGVGDERGMHGPRPLDFFMDRYLESYVAEMAAFVRAIEQNAPPPVTGQDGRTPVVLGLAAKRSLAEGRPVSVPAQ